MKLVRHGPEFVPVCREDKVKAWADAIQTAVRDRDDGGALASVAALGYANRFWEELEASRTPVKDMMDIPGPAAVQWTLTAYARELLAAPVPAAENLEEDI